MGNLTFTVDTHLFRELGRLLVGRDSTALVELIKNAYDADAKLVTIHGEFLDDPNVARIIVTDNGTGMTESQFENGFLRIASRLKDEGDRHSAVFRRRFTGAKGVGRLAAHKLARKIEIESKAKNQPGLISARIDWDAVEACPTLDKIRETDAVNLEILPSPKAASSGTTLVLTKLRKKWSQDERKRLYSEIQTFDPPDALVNVPSSVTQSDKLLFEKPVYRESRGTDPGFTIKLSGDLEAGEDYWQNLAQTAQWIIEIDALSPLKNVTFNILPTKQGKIEFPGAVRKKYTLAHRDPINGPFFQGRIYIREGVGIQNKSAWPAHASGIRVYMEGFRVLPYGEPSDDWLAIDSVYNARNKTLRYLNEFDFGKADDANEGLVYLRKRSYFGAIFLTSSKSPSLEMLVNREGFIPDQSYLNLVKTIQIAVDLSVRVRAAAKLPSRKNRREERKEGTRQELRDSVASSIEQASTFAQQARSFAAQGDFESAGKFIAKAAKVFDSSSEVAERLQSEGSVLRILASVGTQMTAFVHEMNALLGSASTLELAISRIRESEELPRQFKGKMGRLQKAVSDLRRSVERHASYLTDVTSADARRRRSRQSMKDRFDSALRIFDSRIEGKEIEVRNEIPEDLRSPPMFPAEVTVIFTNLLSNAIKAANHDGLIRVSGRRDRDTNVVRVENTGVRVNVAKGERWFRPFESTTVVTDPILGQGMGMGLTITRNLLEEYGGTISFVEPSTGFSTAIELSLPN